MAISEYTAVGFNITHNYYYCCCYFVVVLFVTHWTLTSEFPTYINYPNNNNNILRV